MFDDFEFLDNGLLLMPILIFGFLWSIIDRLEWTFCIKEKVSFYNPHGQWVA